MLRGIAAGRLRFAACRLAFAVGRLVFAAGRLVFAALRVAARFFAGVFAFAMKVAILV
jgi:hypothetical protein